MSLRMQRAARPVKGGPLRAALPPALAVWKATLARLTARGPGGLRRAVSSAQPANLGLTSTAAVGRLEIATRPELADALATATATRLQAVLGRLPNGLRTRKLYHLDLGLGPDELAQVLAALVDPVSETGAVGVLADPGSALRLCVGFRPGVTDTVGRSVLRAAEDRLGRPLRPEAAGPPSRRCR